MDKVVDRKRIKVLWVDKLSIFSLYRVISACLGGGVDRVYYFEASKKIKHLLLLVAKFGGFKIEAIKVPLGDMWVGNQSMATEYIFDLQKISRQTKETIKALKLYKDICKLLPSEHVDIFFEHKIAEDIRSLLHLFLSSKWENHIDAGVNQNVIICKSFATLAIFANIVADDKCSFRGYKSPEINGLKQWVRGLFISRGLLIGRKKSSLDKAGGQAKVAVHYVEGADLEKRSDLFWYPGGNIDPKNVLIYFDLNKSAKEPISDDIQSKIENMGMQVVCLQKKALANPKQYQWIKLKDKPVVDWKKLASRGEFLNPVDKWLLLWVKNLIAYTNRWITFYKFFNIKVVMDIGASLPELIAQTIALDVVGGVRAGVQRSTVAIPQEQPFLKYNVNHLFFIWGKEAISHRGTSRVVERLVISGFPFDQALRQREQKQEAPATLKGGRKFTIALFPSGFLMKSRISRRMTVEFYSKFFEWLFADEDIILIAKEKKLKFFHKLTEIKDLIAKAQNTGRFIQLDNAVGRFPSDASFNADIAVGTGVSSALNEAVIAGCRGVHCDFAKFYFHPYYQWGRERIIYDNLDDLMQALKRYKDNPQSESRLGDWSSNIDILEPFRDARAGLRIGSYVKSLLEGFNSGMSRQGAFAVADSLYSSKWGEEKVVKLKQGVQSAA